ncbi:nuclear transcription factor Y subunit gamma-like isoform X3 [Oncorhynchus kisutch]|uniref:nuclear transcription factor Y subunit gamma-like isoform X3 n=1 Tax=Oncorhynchus kisutch TaxID=8019 RepID=UPI0012DD0350|nr:nuclear transcription factor Y subunit gamma-like isoform X3 [Oncorhynchus kisutch]
MKSFHFPCPYPVVSDILGRVQSQKGPGMECHCQFGPEADDTPVSVSVADLPGESRGAGLGRTTMLLIQQIRLLNTILLSQRGEKGETQMQEEKRQRLVSVADEAHCAVSMSADSFGAGGSDAQQSLQSFWPRVMEEIRNLTVKDFRVQELPLARIKKIMKLDEDVKMISAEAPVLFAKAAQIFITELTLRAWIHTEDNKRRTLQRNDIAMAITKFDQFDFLIDIVPRDELKPPKRQEEVRQSVAPAEPVQYYFTLAQQPGQVQGQQATGQQATTIQPGQIIIAQPQQGQVLQGTTMQQLQQVQVAQSQGTPITGGAPMTMQVGDQQVQIVQASSQGQTQTVQSGQTMQVMQQIITNSAEIQQIPVQLNNGQLQYIRLAQPVSGTQVVQGQIQTLGNTQQITQTEQGQQQFNQFTDGQQLYQIQQVMPAGQDLSQPLFIQSTNQTADGQVTTQFLQAPTLT